MRFAGAYDNVFDILRPQYVQAIKQLTAGGASNGRDAVSEHLGSHLVVFYWRGRISLNSTDLLPAFFAAAAPELRRTALDFAGRSLLNSHGEVSEVVLNRLVALWEYRLTEAQKSSDPLSARVEVSSFSSWFASGEFDTEWSLDQLAKVISITGGLLVNAFSSIKRLAEIAPTTPYRSVRILEQLLFGTERNWLYLSSMAEVGTILRAANASNDEAAVAVVRQIIDALAEAGDMTYRSLVV